MLCLGCDDGMAKSTYKRHRKTCPGAQQMEEHNARVKMMKSIAGQAADLQLQPAAAPAATQAAASLDEPALLARSHQDAHRNLSQIRGLASALQGVLTSESTFQKTSGRMMAALVTWRRMWIRGM